MSILHDICPYLEKPHVVQVRYTLGRSSDLDQHSFMHAELKDKILNIFIFTQQYASRILTARVDVVIKHSSDGSIQRQRALTRVVTL
jgi:hypothetical protein